MKFKCECREFEVKETKIVIIDGKVVKSGSYCNDCKTFGKEIREFVGWGTIVSKKGGKV
tara:strand:- start:344 stop:520 length:177 start_codon:yes stop_codon:yes gene_type:complete